MNPTHPIEKLNFKLIRLGEDGLLRIIEALNVNPNIKSAHLGIITDNQLKLVAKNLKYNKSLQKIKFQECFLSPWSKENKALFIKLLSECDLPLEIVSFEGAAEVK